MSYSYKCYSDTKDIMKKYVNAVEGAARSEEHTSELQSHA